MLLTSSCANIQRWEQSHLGKREKGEKEVMRFMLKFSFPTTNETNAWVRHGIIRQKIESTLEALQPEAAYFGPTDGARGGYWVINIDEASEIPPKVEPFSKNWVRASKSSL